MPRLSAQPHIARTQSLGVFAGFAVPTSNTTFVPNQFFDVCLRHYSRGVVRLVGYLIRQTLGWCDANGEPLRERLQVSYRELIDTAGISRSQIRRSLDEAIAGKFIQCVEAGKPATAYSQSASAQYELRWDARPEYLKDPKKFEGFFEGEGNRTDIPNQFFDHVIPTEPLSVTKVVGSVIRFSIGFQVRHGRRRQQVELSYRDIERWARIRDTHTLAEAIRTAEDHHYVIRLNPGLFDPNGGVNSRPALFAMRWADSSPFISTGSKTPAALLKPERFENPSGTGSKTTAANRFENPSDIETKLTKEKCKQPQANAETQEAHALLKKEGFSEEAAQGMAKRHSGAQIREQIAWLPRRAPSHNRLGMLRRAIEENWSAPEEVRHAELSNERQFAQHFYAGLAGNPGLPVAEPSRRDLELAAGFLERLRATRPTTVEPATWARAFARYVTERRKERDVPSLVLALRLHGDAWLLRFSQEQHTRRKQEVDTKRSAHRAQHEAAWLNFIAEAEETCRDRKAYEYAEFLQRQQGSRWRLSASDPKRARLLEFAQHFQLPDFWHWDAEFNPTPFSPCA